MKQNPDSPTRDETDDSLEDMMQHLEAAKQRDRSKSRRRNRSSTSGLQAKIQNRTDVAVLASNHEARLEEIAANEAVTHRSGKPWTSAKVGVASHGRLPIYYRLDSEVAYKGYISQIVIYPEKNTAQAEELLQHITEADTYSEYHDKLDTTTFVVTDGERLDDPFPQTELRKLSGDGTIDKGFSRQPAYVYQRPGDFPDFA